MRGRYWRRHIEEKVVIKRLNKQIFTNNYSYYSNMDVNRNYYKKQLVIDFLESKRYFFVKNSTTDFWNSRSKGKYSPNKIKRKWGRSGDSPDTREWNKRYLLNILKENELK